MTLTPPQGAQSADPVREAAQALIDATDTIVPEHLTANEAMDWCEIDNAKVDAAWDALRTALAAPPPECTPVTREEMQATDAALGLVELPPIRLERELLANFDGREKHER